jgi:transposase-like protein
MVAVDETKIKADGEWCYVWAAIDVDTRELLAVWVSWQRNILNAEAFLSVGGMHKQACYPCRQGPMVS